MIKDIWTMVAMPFAKIAAPSIAVGFAVGAVIIIIVEAVEATQKKGQGRGRWNDNDDRREN